MSPLHSLQIPSHCVDVYVITKYFFTLFCTCAGLELRPKQHNRNILLASGTVVYTSVLWKLRQETAKMETCLGYIVKSC